MNELFEEMKNDYETFCRSAQRFMDSVKGQQEIKTDTPDYNSWIGKKRRISPISILKKRGI